MRVLLTWVAAAASLVGLFFTLEPPSGSLTFWQNTLLIFVILIFGAAAFFDMRDEWRRSAKTYRSVEKINNYMYAMLKNCGRCEVCSRDASWITDPRIYELLQKKASRGELTFLVHKATLELQTLRNSGAEIIEYGLLGFDPLTRFTIANAGNPASAYVAVGRRKPNEPHTIEELDSSHPTYSMAIDLIRSIRVTNDNFKKVKEPLSYSA